VEEKQQQQEGRYQLQEQYRDDRNRNANGYNTGSSSQWSEQHNPYQQNQQHHPSVIYDGAVSAKSAKYTLVYVLCIYLLALNRIAFSSQRQNMLYFLCLF